MYTEILYIVYETVWGAHATIQTQYSELYGQLYRDELGRDKQPFSPGMPVDRDATLHHNIRVARPGARPGTRPSTRCSAMYYIITVLEPSAWSDT